MKRMIRLCLADETERLAELSEFQHFREWVVIAQANGGVFLEDNGDYIPWHAIVKIHFEGGGKE